MQWLENVRSTADAYLFESAEQFARELWGFIASGLSVEARDQAVFRLPERSVNATAALPDQGKAMLPNPAGAPDQDLAGKPN